MTEIFATPFGDVPLTCNSESQRSPNRAWNQADAYLLNALHEAAGSTLSAKKLAVVNDQFGALTCALTAFDLDIYSDSAIFKRWLKINLNKTEKQIQPIDSLSQSKADIYLVKLPKTLHFFQHILSILSFKEHITIYVAGMQRHWPKTFFEAAHDYFSDVIVFPGVKKAKCMQLKGGLKNPEPPVTQLVQADDFDLSCVNFPNVFSRDQLDIGTRFFLERFPTLRNAKHVVDLGCGNGILGIQALKQNPNCEVSFIDESYYAMQSCQRSLEHQQIDLTRAHFYQNDSCFGLDLTACDAVLCNPPFHQHHLIGNHLTQTMIQHAHKLLKNGGQLFLIGNRHLQYHRLLRRYFSRVKPCAENSKFIMYQADKVG